MTVSLLRFSQTAALHIVILSLDQSVNCANVFYLPLCCVIRAVRGLPYCRDACMLCFVVMGT